jgi:hypothetical protein
MWCSEVGCEAQLQWFLRWILFAVGVASDTFRSVHFITRARTYIKFVNVIVMIWHPALPQTLKAESPLQQQ